MNRYQISFLAILSMISISGCSLNMLNVSYFSDPPGATLYQDNQRFGFTPILLRYQITEEDRKRGYSVLRGTSVVWASGATANIKSLRADLSIGQNLQFTFRRPADHPGMEADVKFALELERLAIMRRQAEAQEAQAAVQLFGGLGQPRQPAVTNCVSRPSVLGGSVSTTCY